MILLYLLVPAAYLVAAWPDWQRLAQPTSPQSSGVAALSRWLPAFALTGHAVLVASSVFTRDGLDLSLVNATSAVAGSAALFAWSVGLGGALPGVSAITLPVAALASTLPGLLPNPLFIVAALQALVLLGLERRLHRGLPDPHAGPVPLLTLEQFLFRLLDAGFVLLTITLASGAIFSEDVFGRPFRFTHKIVFSVLAWFTFGALLVGRHRYGWRGRSALMWVLAGTVLLVLAYFGSKFVLEVILGR